MIYGILIYSMRYKPSAKYYDVFGGDKMFHDKLRYLRVHQELSQGEVARRLSISFPSLAVDRHSRHALQ